MTHPGARKASSNTVHLQHVSCSCDLPDCSHELQGASLRACIGGRSLSYTNELLNWAHNTVRSLGCYGFLQGLPVEVKLHAIQQQRSNLHPALHPATRL